MSQDHLFLRTQLVLNSASGNFNFERSKPELGKQVCHDHQKSHSRSGTNDLWISMTNGKLPFQLLSPAPFRKVQQWKSGKKVNFEIAMDGIQREKIDKC